MDLSFLKPTDAEIRRLALDETDPAKADEFAPIEKGPFVAILLLVLVGLVAIPAHLWRGFRYLLSSKSPSSPETQ